MKSYLFVYSIGPVQSFIAAARKIEDFWSGSFLLSYLTEKTITYAFENTNHEIKLISPSITESELQEKREKPTQIASLPNRFLLKVKGKSDSDIIQFGIYLEKRTKEVFLNIGNRAFKEVFPTLKEQNDINTLA